MSNEYKAWVVTYMNFRGRPARRIIHAATAKQAREDFRASDKGTAEANAKIITVVQE
jgi:hypothetical protein